MAPYAPRTLCPAVLDNVALSWPGEPGHASDARLCGGTWGERALISRALIELGDAGVIQVRREDAMPTVTLSPDGQRVWAREQAGSSLPGLRQQPRAVYQVLQLGTEPVVEVQLQVALSLPALQTRQVLLTMRSLGTVRPTLHQGGAFQRVELQSRSAAWS